MKKNNMKKNNIEVIDDAPFSMMFILGTLVFVSLGMCIASFMLVENFKQENEQLETKLEHERYDKTMQRLQLEQLRTCVITQARMQDANPNIWLTSDCYRYAEVK